MSEIKTELKKKLGYTSIFYFLNELYTNIEYPGPYLEIDKGLYLIYHLIKEDCVAFDGGYTLFLNKFFEICDSKGIELSDKNFFYPIRKEIGKELNEQERYFNGTFGKFRDLVENQFCELHNTYKRFSNNNSTIKTSDYKYINLQLKVAFLLKNIKRFSEKFNIITQEHHKLWIDKNFEFPCEKKLIDIVYINEME
ncbi:hypothetical protein BDA99DRAFT_447831 [Phascolomyces articulosus]|uniref:Uncharacterized protein n=1 Tax=Phascolomyces articulosus TaxID=60185 RepID=A0AAD5K0I4_9FUNG|nr:hypothetical protein BDA99DRAFT_447831 [Phascolomyces articulosus]